MYNGHCHPHFATPFNMNLLNAAFTNLTHLSVSLSMARKCAFSALFRVMFPKCATIFTCASVLEVVSPAVSIEIYTHKHLLLHNYITVV